MPLWLVFGGSLVSPTPDMFPLSHLFVCKPPKSLTSSVNIVLFDTLSKWTLCCNHTG